MQTLKRSNYMVRYFCKLFLLLLVAMVSILQISCKDDDAPYFERSSYYENCFLDSDKVYSLEEAIGHSLDVSCSISNENEGVAEVQTDKGTGKHIIIPKKIGYTQIELKKGEGKASVMIYVKTEAINSWKIKERIEKIDCAPELKENIRSDIYMSQVLPKLNVGEDIYFDYGGKGRWCLEVFDDASSKVKSIYVDFSRGDSKYSLYVFPNMDKKQYVTFSLDGIQNTSEKRPVKFGTFTCDLTDYYQQKYGEDKVKKVELFYKVQSYYVIM